jgi:hypothetical protein
MKTFKSGVDFAFEKYGAGRISDYNEYEKILEAIAKKGSYVSWQKKWFAYSPAKGKPGHLIFDENVSIAVLRHEFQHLLDDEQNGFPGLGWYLQRPQTYWRLEFRGYLAELSFARERQDFDLAHKIIENMRSRRFELLGY